MALKQSVIQPVKTVVEDINFRGIAHDIARIMQQTVGPDDNTPTVDDDESEGFEVGAIWVTDGGNVYILIDNTDGAAEWLLLGGPFMEERLTVIQNKMDDLVNIMWMIYQNLELANKNIEVK